MNHIFFLLCIGHRRIACSFYLSLNYRLLLVENRKTNIYLRIRDEAARKRLEKPRRDLLFAGFSVVFLDVPSGTWLLHQFHFGMLVRAFETCWCSVIELYWITFGRKCKLKRHPVDQTTCNEPKRTFTHQQSRITFSAIKSWSRRETRQNTFCELNAMDQKKNLIDFLIMSWLQRAAAAHFPIQMSHG